MKLIQISDIKMSNDSCHIKNIIVLAVMQVINTTFKPLANRDFLKNVNESE